MVQEQSQLHDLQHFVRYVPPLDHLVGLVVKTSASREADLGSISACSVDLYFSGSSRTSDFKTGTPVAALPFAWRYRVTGGPDVKGLVGSVSRYCDWVRLDA